MRRRERMTVTLHTKMTSTIPTPEPSVTPLDMRSLPFAITPQKINEKTPEYEIIMRHDQRFSMFASNTDIKPKPYK